MGIENEVLKLIEKPINELGYIDVSVTFTSESGSRYLRVLIDKDDVISLDDIIKVNDLISPIIENADLIQGAYILDITSYGAEKKIDPTKLKKYVGKYINVHLSHPYKGENYLEGTLESVNEGKVIISFREKTRLIKAELSESDIDKARLAIKF